MGEKLASSDTVGPVRPENSAQNQVRVVWKISKAADVLSSRLQEGVTWRLPTEFSEPPSISVDGQGMVGKLQEVVQRSPELLVRLHSLPRISEDEGAERAPSYVLQVYSPQENLPGFGLTVVCPKITELVTPANLEAHKKSGTVDVNLSWSEGGEKKLPSDEEKEPSHDISRLELETALWVLKGLKTENKRVNAQTELVKLT